MKVRDILRPRFWDHHDVAAGTSEELFNFQRMWKQAVFFIGTVACIPVILVGIIDYTISKKALDADIALRTGRLVSNTRRTISHFLEEKKFALEFVMQNNSFVELSSHVHLERLLEDLRSSFGGFTDLGVIDWRGFQNTYVGPYELEGVRYSDTRWYHQVIRKGSYISDIFPGVRKVPHFVIGLRSQPPEGRAGDADRTYVIRATIDTRRFHEQLALLETSGEGDAFIINHDGILQTPSRAYGRVLEKIPLNVPPYSPHSEVLDITGPNGRPIVLGYAYIEDTPFILMICNPKPASVKAWQRTRIEVFGFLIVSVLGMLLVIIGVSTYLVNQIYLADQRRIAMLHQVEYANKMASIGRLAAGVAHEINNPLAIINEKGGLIQDMLELDPRFAGETRLNGLIDAILQSVHRCATITRRLLSFARHMGGDTVRIQRLNLREVIEEVLGFVGKEAGYRSIQISVDEGPDVPPIVSERGKLQQIFLNLVNNAFAAMEDCGRLDVTIRKEKKEHVTVTIADNGSGIPAADLKNIFEPFFSTKTHRGGTGLGLSITYGLVRELGGLISVDSTVGRGTIFTIRLPLEIAERQGESDACTVGG